MPRSLRPLHARFDAAALRHNHAVARHHAGAARLWSVIKADAYGHGFMRAAEALAEAADGFALIELDAAIALREAGFRQPILMLEGFYGVDELPLFAEHRLIPVLHSLAQIEDLRAAALPARLPAYLKLNTGMNRLGLDGDEFAVALERVSAMPEISGITLMSHFADADNERGVAGQMARFEAMREGHRSLPVSLANSAALLRHPETRGGGHDWARPGIMLYGSSPFPETPAEELGLQPVMTLASEIIAVRDLKPGDRVGYGGTFEAGAPMRIGLVACGYGDGYPRHAPTGTPVLVDGRRTRTLGRVSMDKLCVDLGDIPQAGVGTPVTLWGRFGETTLSVDEVAASAGTISYELLCAMKARVPVVDA
ncbi:MAG: alanine racemase [Candidatus Nitricoxidivorans perseverans]|uniref:Alanine racemase n=1 Tax=Candidatus Nitricoxidivorans perseverans TaxID=2975601 RepID=A0AA49FL89_9PROT|nr:MAG: alanine racemase [Candidatus Nitricoxidivorans perseverans]